MKTLKFTTSKGDFALMDGTEQIDQTLKALLDEYTPVAKVSEMTEEQFAEVVEISFNTPRMYKDYINNMPGFTAKESFESLVKSLGWYLWENPIKFETHHCCNETDLVDIAAWQEAESKTLYNAILLKKI